ncbi:hypothetical protein PhiCh1p48 [Natrialba phage PhiCh1]|uniref:Virus protein phiCh1-VP47 n=2 Tax=root TaxID=1 RepID=D3T2J5_NATMM|nr:hypothetical protein [Natrialba magadii]NP_665965.1 hypothetical protein PhiCh1p48 [Natrialba phage PhiCh1]YP_010078076.1 uncharacterized protein KMC42_gp46 [Natrialba phage PhiCh1]AAM88721.1 unknown [Natrialba phage PhiCh1]ADD07804.1 virus protein phiCh1-VP47 [Natrialba magadii ATCC 43099]ELY22957.1 hypothetical protein C500_20875 [Natrialba magadii ATCC 43099]QBJ01227.1 uncharacterized protein PhiCh1_225 [Natrialba phage PhiCh1]
MAEKRDRNPWEDRYDDDEEDAENSETSESSKETKTSDVSEASKSSKTSKKTNTEITSEGSERSGKPTVRERKNVNMYLPEDLVEELQGRFFELEAEWRREHGEDLPKNEKFYPAVIQAALEETTVQEQLDLD